MGEKNADEQRLDKLIKHSRDVQTKRGIINCLSRETSHFCDCMKEKKKEAKSMEKVQVCSGCKKYFPKIDLRYCSKCQMTPYCSIECAKLRWPIHKLVCKKKSKKEEPKSERHIE